MMTAIVFERQDRTLPVPTDAESSVTAPKCRHCGKELPAGTRRKTCSDACRQAMHRTSPCYRNTLDRQSVKRLNRRNRRYAEKNKFKCLDALDGRYGGPDNNNVPALGAMRFIAEDIPPKDVPLDERKLRELETKRAKREKEK